ncbi:MAG: efflux RND transporter permease subunit, partial [Actinobacteria bacterium]|nr:efflux RND transporter permease subunit [Actinomycetota bacterium]
PAPPGTELTLPVITHGRMTEVNEFEEMIVRALPNGSMIRLKDVARIELGAQSYDLQGRFKGKPTTFLLTFLSPGANALETVSRIRAEMDALAKSFPPGVRYDVPYDTTRFIEVSIREVVQTLGEALVLVVLVVYLFLQSWRATLIPMVAVPVSLIGAFAGMYVLGFSINTLTLFGMVLCIGLVVDDAIVVVENVERHMEGGLAPKEAAKKAMEEVAGPVIAIVLVLVSVFIPTAVLGGITGQLYRQFAVTIAISVTISGFVALTLSPALCALVLKPNHQKKRVFFQWFNRFFEWTRHRYTATVGMNIRRAGLALGIYAIVIGLAIGMFGALPSAFLPEEDQGYFITVVQLPEGASKQRTTEVVSKLERQIQDPAGRDFKRFAAVAEEFIAKAKQDPAIGAIGTSFRVSSPRLSLHVNRERAKALGVPISEVFDTLQAYFGNLYINDFVKFGRVYRVQTEAESQYRSRPEDIAKIYVRAQNEQGTSMIPLDTVVSTEFTSGPDPVTHFNGYNAALVLGGAAPGYSSGQALDALKRVAEEVLVPKGYALDWSGIS